MEVVGRCRNKDDVRKMPELVGLALGILSNGGCDFFGMVAGEIDAFDAGLGLPVSMKTALTFGENVISFPRDSSTIEVTQG